MWYASGHRKVTVPRRLPNTSPLCTSEVQSSSLLGAGFASWGSECVPGASGSIWEAALGVACRCLLGLADQGFLSCHTYSCTIVFCQSYG